ncbi:MAG: hypothetical protein JWP74_1781 [Marmoricola sp.]|nr:hypothetical protein [Marmoricola sp.]
MWAVDTWRDGIPTTWLLGESPEDVVRQIQSTFAGDDAKWLTVNRGDSFSLYRNTGETITEFTIELRRVVARPVDDVVYRDEAAARVAAGMIP